jgi:hypothetical protein
MGIDIGFDLFSPLQTEADLAKWGEFLKEVIRVYENDSVLEISEYELMFKVGEGPSLLRDGRFFRRFSSKISGRCGDAEPYIRAVVHIARRYFYHRIHFWSEYGYEGEPDPMYSWSDINDNNDRARDAYRRAEKWKRRQPFMMFLACNGFLATLSRAVAAVSLVPQSAPITPSQIDTEEQRIASLRSLVFSDQDLIRHIVSFI